MVKVTAHAILRYQERVEAVSMEEARARLSTKAIEAAANFGARFVRLGSGHRVAIQDDHVITVMPPEHHARQVKRFGLGRFGGSTRKAKGWE